MTEMLPCIDCGRPTLGSLAGGDPICYRPCWHRRNLPGGGTYAGFDQERVSQWVRGENVTPPPGMEPRRRRLVVRDVPSPRAKPVPVVAVGDPLTLAIQRNGGRNPFLEGGS